MPRQYLKSVLLLLVSCSVIYFVVELLELHVEPYWVVLLSLCLPLAIVLIRKFPAALIPPVIFVSIFKTRAAASNLDFSDPTFWALCVLLGTMLVYALLKFAGVDQPSLGEVVRAQRQGIVTYLSFVGVITFSYLYSLAPEYGFTELTHFIVIGSALYFSSLFLVRSEADIRHFATSALLLSLALTTQRVLSIGDYSGFALRPDRTVEDITRISAGQLIGMTMLLLLLAPKSMRAPIPRQLLLLCIPWLAAGLTISLARGPILSFIFILALSLWTSKPQIGLLSRKAATVSLVLLVPVFFITLSWVERTETAQVKVEEKTGELASLLNFSSPGGSAGKRLQLYKQALTGFTERPLVGWGLGSFGLYATGADTREYPHNLVLQIAMEQGLAGLAALGAFVLALTRALRKTLAATQGEWAFLSWIVLYLGCTSMFSGDLDDQRPLVLWCGMAFGSWRILKLRFREQRPGRELAGVTPPMLPRRFVSHTQSLSKD